MSVVNKMLRDLEARNASQETTSTDYQPPKRNIMTLTWLVLVLVVVILVALIFYIWPQDKNNDFESTLNQSSQIDNSASRVIAEVKQTQPEKPIKGAMKWIKHPDDSHSDISEVKEYQKQDAIVQLKSEYEIADKKIALLPVQPSVTSSGRTIREGQVTSDKALPTTVAFSKKANRTQDAQAGLKQSINQALREGKTLIAINGLQTLLSHEPEDVRIRKKLASLLFADNRVREAQTILGDGLAAQPQQHDLRLMLARLLAQQNEPKKALSLLLDVSPSLAIHSDFYAYRGALAQRTEEYVQAQQDYQQLVNIEPQKAKWWLGLGIAQDSLGDSASALKSYGQADNEQQLSPEVITFVRQRSNDLVGMK